jgi:predicted Zn finger-like uncharacterized protein
MPEVILNCPQCQRQLRVTEDLVGRPVKCPACGLTFTVPAGGTEPQPVLTVMPADVPEPSPREEFQPGEHYDEARRGRRPEPWDWSRDDRDRARTLLMPPAITLLVLALLGLMLDLMQVVVWSTMADALVKQFQEMSKEMKMPAEPPPAGLWIALHAISAGVCLVIILAAAQMLRRRMYALAIVGCFLPFINFGSYCCFPMVPVGIWAFVVLLQPRVRDAFGGP